MSARAHWETNIGRRRASEAPPRDLPAPSTVTAEAGTGHVALTWSPVEGAAGYLIHHAPGPDGPWTPLDHHSPRRARAPRARRTPTRPGSRASSAGTRSRRWRAPRPAPARSRTPSSATPGTARRRRSPRASTRGGSAGRLNRLWHMIGSERLSQLYTPGVGEEFAEALALRPRRARRDPRARARDLPRRPRRLPLRRARLHDGRRRLRPRARTGATRRWSSSRSCPESWPRIRKRRCSSTAPASACPTTGRRGARCAAALAEHLVERYGIDEVAQLGLRGLERGEPRGLLDRHARRVLQALRPRRRGRQGGRRAGCSSAARRPRRPAGSRTSSTMWSRPARRWTS